MKRIGKRCLINNLEIGQRVKFTNLFDRTGKFSASPKFLDIDIHESMDNFQVSDPDANSEVIERK